MASMKLPTSTIEVGAIIDIKRATEPYPVVITGLSITPDPDKEVLKTNVYFRTAQPGTTKAETAPLFLFLTWISEAEYE